VLPATFIGLIVPGTGYTCNHAITPTTPCSINGVVIQNDGKYLKDGGPGFLEPVPLQFDPRAGVAWTVNRKTVIRMAGRSFHDGTAGVTNQGGPDYLYDKQVLYTDFNSYATGTSATALVPNVSGVVRTANQRPNNVRFTAAVQRDLGGKFVLDAAYVGTRTYHVSQGWNYNAIPAGARFLPQNRDTTVNPTVGTTGLVLNPAAVPDQFLRPILGFNDITISAPTGHSQYDSLQMQLTRRFAGGFELASSYTWARGYAQTIRQNNPLPTTTDRSDIPEHVLVISYMYAIPSVSSRLGGDNKVVAAVLDNWQVSGISTFATGGRGHVSVSYSPSFDFSGGGETCGGYNVVGSLELPGNQRSMNKWFNTDAVQPVTKQGDVGNAAACQQWQFRLPGFDNHDLSLFKDIMRKGGQKLQYRLEVYNLLNSVSFQSVNTSAVFNPNTGAQTNAAFGTVTAARTERRMQMALRYSF
jgi:hypothetical protein